MKTLIDEQTLARKFDELKATVGLIRAAKEDLQAAEDAAVRIMLDELPLTVETIAAAYEAMGDAAHWQVIGEAAHQIQMAYEANHPGDRQRRGRG